MVFILVTFLIKWKGESFLRINAAPNEKKIEWSNTFGKCTIAPSWLFPVHISILQFLKFCGKNLFIRSTHYFPKLMSINFLGLLIYITTNREAKTRLINHSLTILEAKSRRSRSQQGHALCEGSRGESFPTSS